MHKIILKFLLPTMTFLYSEEESCECFMNKEISASTMAITHEVTRVSLYDDLLDLYQKCDNVTNGYLLYMKFVGGKGVDLWWSL